MNAAIITIGDELLIGQVVNTNQAFIAERLTLAGIAVGMMTTVGDDASAILKAYQDAWSTHDVVIVTGGLGPTHDDVTKKTLCTFFETELAPDNDLRSHIASLLKKRNLPWGSAAEEQTLVPRKARLLQNPVGTAPGMMFNDAGKMLVAMPGVPYEMREIVDQSLIPILRGRMTGPSIQHLTLRTTGIAESMLAQQLGNLQDLLQGTTLAFLPSPTGVRLRITARDSDPDRAKNLISGAEQRIRSRVQKYIYGTGEEEIEEVLGRLLTARRMTIAVAESCTGGRIADRLTNVSGSSAYVERALVTYSNVSKIEMLGVPPMLLERHGAVSREVAEAMARGVRTIAHADLGLSTTGIAGPTGGTPDKPVGLVWIGFSDAEQTMALKFNFGDGRLRFKERTSQAALELVRRKLLALD
jgi:competence/damage-inducible protein CinA-like protein